MHSGHHAPVAPHHLPPGQFQIALVHPQIAPNTGNIARLCVATASHLHIVRPMGFTLSDRQLKRSAMDYWPRLRCTLHDDLRAFLAATSAANTRLWLFDSAAATSLWQADIRKGDTLVFGSESRGLPEALTAQFPGQCLRISQVPGERCLNLATAAGIALYHALYLTCAGRAT